MNRIVRLFLSLGLACCAVAAFAPLGSPVKGVLQNSRTGRRHYSHERQYQFRTWRVPDGGLLALNESRTLLDEQGQLNRTVTLTDRSRWQALLTRAGVTSDVKGHALRMLGEWEVAAHEPLEALSLFRRAEKQLSDKSSDRGLVSFDEGLCLFYTGRYGKARKSFEELLDGKELGYRCCRVFCESSWTND